MEIDSGDLHEAMRAGSAHADLYRERYEAEQERERNPSFLDRVKDAYERNKRLFDEKRAGKEDRERD